VEPPFTDSPEFRRLLEGDLDANLTRIALELARDHDPGLDPEVSLAAIDALAARVRDRCPADAPVRAVLGQINWVLFAEESYRGNTEDYYDPRNSFLHEVIQRRTGIPITLCVLYRAVAAGVGLKLEGVNLPAHFVLRTAPGLEEVFIDAFHEGRLLDRNGCTRLVSQAAGRSVRLGYSHFAVCSTREVVARMLQNLKAIYLREHDAASALPVVRRLAALLPEDPDQARDYGLVCLRADRTAEAIGPLEVYVRSRPNAPDSGEVQILLRTARREVASWN
jgi:regulator of sirC expression with transglutaminase-like and TPR domain